MSGGVDSFVTALLLQQRGYEVIGVTLELWGKNELTGVQEICRGLRIPLISRNGEELFRRVVVSSFVDGYLSGYTPSPCWICNSYVKWELLAGIATELDAPFIATGHYVRIVRKDERYYIRKGVDVCKDQSYFLWGVSQDILARAITPLGDYTKAEVKAWALARGYEEMARKKESMGICFLRGMDYRDFIRQYAGEKAEQKPGGIFDRAGRLVGEHSGLLNYTVGQKRGIPVADGQVLYVAAMNPEENRIVVDRKTGLQSMTLVVREVNAVCRPDLLAADVKVKIRGLGLNPEGCVRVEELRGNRVHVSFSDPAWAVAPGQPVAFYRGDLLVGGGIAE